MVEKLITYLKFGNRFYGVEQTQINGKTCFYGVTLKKTKQQLDINTSFEAENLETLKEHVPKGAPLSLVINTNSVLTKWVEGNSNESLKLVHMAFPNIKVEDFYYETISQGKNHFVSICRKTYVEDLLNSYLSQGFVIIDFTLGNLISTTLVPFIDIESIKTSNASIIIKDKNITKISFDETHFESGYDINGLNVKNTALLSFASALNLIVKSQIIQSSFDDKKNELGTIYNQKRFASQFLKMGLSVLFAILLINFLFFNHYYNEVNTLKETAQVIETSKTKMINLNENVKKTEKMVNDVLKSSSSKSSFYVNAIITDLPEHILLKELNFQPLVKKIKDNKAIENNKNTIVMSGQTYKRIFFSEWISQLEAKSWINSVSILSFEDHSKTASNFIIKLNIHDTEN
ncbi:hypothetical protein [uncultured Winogradskyella sp.]|uniref:hypothetical protein n=1 Tax=uncultured Winogradskyella sp. TaxID=395353 RepID=UPI0026385741|nr:hypothetical protein [uncultured Winogradskyella sp.]